MGQTDHCDEVGGPAGEDLALQLRGQAIQLRTTTETDREALVAIQATPEVMRRWRGEDHDDDFTELLDEFAEGEVHPLTIENAEGQIVGMIQFAEESDPDYRHASIDIYIDPVQHRQGFALDAISTLVEYLFDQRGHHRLTIDPAADNQPAIDCYRKVGFQPVGLLRSYERQPDGTWSDGLLMEMLASDRA